MLESGGRDGVLVPWRIGGLADGRAPSRARRRGAGRQPRFRPRLRGADDGAGPDRREGALPVRRRHGGRAHRRLERTGAPTRPRPGKIGAPPQHDRRGPGGDGDDLDARPQPAARLRHPRAGASSGLYRRLRNPGDGHASIAADRLRFRGRENEYHPLPQRRAAVRAGHDRRYGTQATRAGSSWSMRRSTGRR